MEINLADYDIQTQMEIKEATKQRDESLKEIERFKEIGNGFLYESSKKPILSMFETKVEMSINKYNTKRQGDEQLKKNEIESAERHKKIMINGHNDKIAILKKLANDIRAIERTLDNE